MIKDEKLAARLLELEDQRRRDQTASVARELAEGRRRAERERARARETGKGK